MNSNFNDDAKEQVRQRADMGAVIGRYVSLKGRGRTLLGLCPFHKEKTPSFTVDPSRGFYYCFGCGKGGDIFSFVQEMEGVGFREALQMLAEETGVRLEERPSGDGRPPPGGAPGGAAANTKEVKTGLLAIHDEAANFFYKCLKGSPQAISYFKSRGVRAETVRDFRLGYAPAGWSGLFDHLRGQGFAQPQIMECGLAVSGDGGAHDRFRDRVMFPLHDLNGRVIAFAGRGLNEDAKPKYMNSPETTLYRKSDVLYGMHLARAAVREEGRLLIVEGYMDYIALYEAGVRNVAAVSGTAFTEKHAGVMMRLATKKEQDVTLVFDGDRAGLSAAERAAYILAPFDFKVSILSLPGGDDPDSFVRREGADAFRRMLASAKPACEFLIDKFRSEMDNSSYSKGIIIDRMAQYAHRLPDGPSKGIMYSACLKKVADSLLIDAPSVSKRFNSSGNLPQAGVDGWMAAGDTGQDRKVILDALEEDFFWILVNYPELIARARQDIFPEMFTDTDAGDIYSIILEAYDRSNDLGSLPDVCSNKPEIGRVISMLAVKQDSMEDVQDELERKMLLLREKCYKMLIAEFAGQLRNCSESEKGPLLELQKDCGAKLNDCQARIRGLSRQE